MGDFFNKHKGVRRLLLLWACCLITYSVVKNHLADTVAVAVIGLLTVVIGFYQWSRNKDDCTTDKP